MTELDKIDALLVLHRYRLPDEDYKQLIELIKIFKLSYEDVKKEVEDILNKKHNRMYE